MTKQVTYKHGAKYRIYPSVKQQKYLHQVFGCCRKYYNTRVTQIDDERQAYFAYKEAHNGNPKGFKYNWITQKQLREEHPYMKIADGLALSNVQLAFDKAFNDYCQGKSGAPKFKKKTEYPHTYTTNNQKMKNGRETIYIHDDPSRKHGYLLHIPKIDKHGGDIQIRLHKPINGCIRNATIEYTASREWYVALIIEEQRELTDEDAHGDIIDRLLALDDEALLSSVFGGDLGLESYVYGTDGVSYDDPELASYRQLERKLHREQRKLGKKAARLRREGRKLCECRNYQKQRIRVARVYEKIRRKRHDFLHKLSRRLVNSHDVLAFEDLCVKGMLRNRCLARGVSDAAWYTFLQYCRYKAEWAGKVFVQCDRWFPSTRSCSHCGGLTGPRGCRDLGVREWVCSSCGAVHSRDGNAAWNVLLEGLRVLSVTVDPRWGEVL